MLHPCALKIRAVMTFAAFHQSESVSLSFILEAAFWRSESTFIQHYLRDLASCKGDGSFGFSFITAYLMAISSCFAL